MSLQMKMTILSTRMTEFFFQSTLDINKVWRLTSM